AMEGRMAGGVGEKEEEEIDEGWDKALDPVGKLDRQRWLDVFVGTQAYQAGVDKLHFRSEKKFSGGVVVMEVHYDRAAPAEDKFEVQVLDRAGKLLRREVYTRDEVEKANRELHERLPPPPEKGQGPEPPDAARKRAAQEARWKKVEKIFPKREEKKE